MMMRCAAALAVILSAASATAAMAQADSWATLPRMVLERQFAGPLQDTVIQRLRDPVDGTVCYLYLPISVPHSPAAPNGYVQYGGNVIGSIACQPGARTGARRGPP